MASGSFAVSFSLVSDWIAYFSVIFRSRALCLCWHLFYIIRFLCIFGAGLGQLGAQNGAGGSWLWTFGLGWLQIA